MVCIYHEMFTAFCIGIWIVDYIVNSTKVQNPRRKMQVALLAEPKTPLESVCLYNTMSTSKEMWWL